MGLFDYFKRLIVKTDVAIGQSTAPDASAALEVDSTTKGFLPPRMTTAQRDAISSPADGLTLFNTDDDELQSYDADSAIWVSGGSGSGSGTGVRNYISNNNAEVDTTGWTRYANTSAAVKPDDFGGTPNGSTTWTRNTTNPEYDTADFLLTKDAANRQGEGVYYGFTLKDGDLHSAMTLIAKATTSANYADGDVRFYLVGSSDGFSANFDIIEFSPTELLAGSHGDVWTQVQTHATNTAYRFCIHIASTNATAYTVNFDDFVFGKTQRNYGAVLRSPALAGFISPYGGTSDPDGWMICDGRTLSRTTYSELFDAIGTSYGSGDGSTTFHLPDLRGQFIRGVDGTAGVDPDKTGRTANNSGGNTGNNVGSEQADATAKNGLTVTSSGSTTTGTAYGSKSTVVGAADGSGHGLVELTDDANNTNRHTHSVPNHTHTLGAGDNETRPTNVYVNFVIKLYSDYSNVLMSDHEDGRVVSATYRTNAGNTITSGNPVDFEDRVKDTHGLVTVGSSWKLTVDHSGPYKVFGRITFNSVEWQNGNFVTVRAYINGVASNVIGDYRPETTATTYVSVPFVGEFDLDANDYIDVRILYSRTAGSAALYNDAEFNWVTIEKVQGPSAIAASETISFEAQRTDASTVADGAIWVFEDVLDNSHGSYNSSTGVFTATSAGLYVFGAMAFATDSIAATNYFEIALRKNGSIYAAGDRITRSATASNITSKVERQMRLVSGDTVDIINNSGATRTPLNNGAYNYFYGRRIGL